MGCVKMGIVERVRSMGCVRLGKIDKVGCDRVGKIGKMGNVCWDVGAVRRSPAWQDRQNR